MKTYVTRIFLTALFIIDQNWKEPKWPPADEGVNYGIFVQCDT